MKKPYGSCTLLLVNVQNIYLCIPTTGSVPLQDMYQGITAIRYVSVYTHNKLYIYPVVGIYIYIYCCGYLCIPTTGSVPLQDMCQGITSIRYVLVYTHNRIRTRVTYTLHKICTVEPDYNGHLGTKSSWMLYRGGLFTEWRSKSKSS